MPALMARAYPLRYNTIAGKLLFGVAALLLVGVALCSKYKKTDKAKESPILVIGLVASIVLMIVAAIVDIMGA